MFLSTKTANVVYRFLARMNLEAAVFRDAEGAACGIGLERGLSGDLHRAFAGGDLHQFRCAAVEGELAARQDDADGLARAVGEKYRVRHALAVEEYVGLLANRNVVEDRKSTRLNS